MMGPAPSHLISPYPQNGNGETSDYEQQKGSSDFRKSQVLPVDAPTQPLPNHRPITLKWPFLCVLIAVIMGYMAMTEYALQTLPAETGRGEIGAFSDLPAGQRKTIEAQGIPSTITSSVSSTIVTVTSVSNPQKRVPQESPTPTPPPAEIGIPTEPPVEQDPNEGTPDPDPGNGGGGGGGGGGDLVVTASTPVEIPTVIDGESTTITSTSTMLNVVTTVPNFVTADVTTLTDSNGVPTATFTSTPPPVSTPTVITTTNARGETTVISTSALVSASTSVLTDSNGVATATQTFTRLSRLVARHPAAQSVLLRMGGIFGVQTAIRSLKQMKFLPFLSSLLLWCSTILIPLSTEAVALKLYAVRDTCNINRGRGCMVVLAVYTIPARATMALLAFMIVLLCFIIISLRRWTSGVAHNPWSIAGMAALSTNPHTRAAVAALPTRAKNLKYSRMLEHLEHKNFRLGYFSNARGEVEYGVMVHSESAPLKPLSPNPGETWEFDESAKGRKGHRVRNKLPFIMLSVVGRVVFALVLTGVLILVVYYRWFTSGDAAFNVFMSKTNFGVRFLFTCFGVAINFCWSSLFEGMAIMGPYQRMAVSAQPADRSILLSPPTNSFTGLWSAIKRRHFYLIVAAFAASIAEFLPLLLNNVPYRVTQTLRTSIVCTYTSIAVLALMLVLVIASFFMKWPEMPVDPTTVAGAMYYVCDSKMVWSFAELSTVGKAERNGRVGRLGALTFLANLRILDLDLLPDWPGITSHTFTATLASQGQKKRIQSVEWALYYLFCLWDPEEAQNKLDQYFPPVDQVQSLNLRAALLRSLEQVKKNGFLGRDTVIRKTMLDECKGDRLADVLATFSFAVVRKVTSDQSEESGEHPSIAERLALENRGYAGERSELALLKLAHQVSLSHALRKKNESRAMLDDFSELLDVKERGIFRKKELVKSVDAHDDAHDVSESDKLEVGRLVQNNWAGNERWIESLLYGDANARRDGLLSAPFDKVWRRVQAGRLSELDDRGSGLVEELESRVRFQRERLQKWKGLRSTLGDSAAKGTQSLDPMPSSKNGLGLQLNAHQNLHLGRLSPEKRPKQLEELRSAGKPAKQPLRALPPQPVAATNRGRFSGETSETSETRAGPGLDWEEEELGATELSTVAAPVVTRLPQRKPSHRAKPSRKLVSEDLPLAEVENRPRDLRRPPFESSRPHTERMMPKANPTAVRREEEVALPVPEMPDFGPALETTLKKDHHQAGDLMVSEINNTQRPGREPSAPASLYPQGQTQMKEQETPPSPTQLAADAILASMDNSSPPNKEKYGRLRSCSPKAQLERRRSQKKSRALQRREGSYFPKLAEVDDQDDTLVLTSELMEGEQNYDDVFMSRPKIKTSPVPSPLPSPTKEW
ncbi:unnamed protein product [Parascedosporium putredinis]|uniref:HAUS augmin-like complex subunit 6 N-terminal domain-containing protein n=1 Tax=Parascedosporium putredinis TaxID=1442378 RepID=A0A9P1H3X6_9PEZI|nr:unnamed protein product [Parascedosporium putredinis]CAI7995197.1 unnamed protein product [Parascedosporium putredinis]